MPCALCHCYSYRYRWRAVDCRGPESAWGRHYSEDQQYPRRYWIRECVPACEANAQLAKLWEAREEIDESLLQLYQTRRLLGVRYVATNLALTRLGGPEPSSVRNWQWDVPQPE